MFKPFTFNVIIYMFGFRYIPLYYLFSVFH